MKTRFLYRPDHPLSNERGFVNAASEHELFDAHVAVFGDGYMDGVQAPDGSDIGSRRKRRDWMRTTGSADLSDFKESGAKAAARREDYLTTGGDHKERREQVGRALYNVKMGRKT